MFLPNMAKCVRPNTALLKKEATFSFTLSMEEAVRVFPDRDAVIDKSRPFRLHCDASTDGLRSTLEQEPLDSYIRPIVDISRATLTNKRNWTPMELEVKCVVWSIRCLCRSLFSGFFLIYTDHECLQQISKICEHKSRIQRGVEFLSAYNFRLSYRRVRENANADFLSRIPLPPTAKYILGSSALTDTDDLGVYLIQNYCGYTTPSCPIPGVGLGGLVPSSYNNSGTGANSFPTTVLGGLPLTKDDFRTHRAPMSLMHMTGPMANSIAAPTEESYLSYVIYDQHEASRSNCVRRTQSRTAILAGKIPLRSNNRAAVRSGFAASAAPAPPPKASFRSSPPSRPARLGSTIPLGRPASPRLTPTPNPQMDHSPP